MFSLMGTKFGALGQEDVYPNGYRIWGPLGQEDVCHNFALTLPKFLFSNSSNFKAKAKAKANPQSPGLAPNAYSGNDWGPIPAKQDVWATAVRAPSLETLAVIIPASIV